MFDIVKGQDGRDVQLSKEETEDSERAEEDDKNIREEREQAGIAKGAMIVNQAPACHHYHHFSGFIHPHSSNSNKSIYLFAGRYGQVGWALASSIPPLPAASSLSFKIRRSNFRQYFFFGYY